MALLTNFPNAPERIKGAIGHLDSSLASYFTDIRAKTFVDELRNLCKAQSEKSIDEAIRVRFAKSTSEWRVALRAWSLVYLMNAMANGDRSDPGRIIAKGRSSKKIEKLDIGGLDDLTRAELRSLGSYKKFDPKITDGLRKYLEKPFVQDPHIEILVSQGQLTSKDEAYKGICMGFVVRWLSYHVLRRYEKQVQGKRTGTKHLEKRAGQALEIEKSHVEHGSKVETGEELLDKLKDQDKRVEEAKGVAAKLRERRQLTDLQVRQSGELTVATASVTLKKYGLELDADHTCARTFVSVDGYNEGFEAFSYATNHKGLAQLVAELKPPAYFVLSIKWVGGKTLDKGAHVWAGALTETGFRLFDPNAGTFFTSTDREALVQAMYQKWTDEDRYIESCVYLPVKPRLY